MMLASVVLLYEMVLTMAIRNLVTSSGNLRRELITFSGVMVNQSGKVWT
jgi:hypothetical protein